MSKKGTLFSLVIFFLMLLSLPGISYGQSALDGFDPNANGAVWSIAVQADGKILIGGQFTTIGGGGGVTRNRIARLNPNGSLDMGFDPNANGAVWSIAVQADGKILIGGQFTTIGVTPRNRIARLNPNGSLDMGFDPNANGTVSSIAVQADGKILIGGDFTTIGGGGGVTRNYIARLKPNGTLDEGFNPNANSWVYSIAVQADDKILIGGEFTTIGVTPRNHIARLNPDGSLDEGFFPNANSLVESIAVQADGKILIGGEFTTIGGVPGVARNHIARLNPNGSLDAGFDPNADDEVLSIAVQADGKILIGGEFTTIGVTPRNRITRLNPNGSLDMSFDPNANAIVSSIAVQADGKILIGGDFTTIGGVGGETRNRIARLNPDGSLDEGLDPNVNNWVYSTAIQADGKILIGGEFTTIGVTPRNYIARLNPDGSLDEGFNPNVNGKVESIVVQADGKILIGGAFTTIGEGPAVTRNHIARLNPNGSLDAGFNPNANSWVYSIAVQADDKILIGGDFTTIGTDARNRIARLNPNGSLDAGFDPNANSLVYSIAVQADGKIVIGGKFTTIGGVPGVVRNYIARINPNGSLDAGFDPNADDEVLSIAVQADGKILIGGVFTTIGGVGGLPRNYIARLNPNGSLDAGFNPNANGFVFPIAVQADGKILIGGYFTTIGGVGGLTRNHIARLNPNGTLDGFDPNADGTVVYSIAIQADGKILIGGDFTTIGGVARNYIARLTNTDAALQEIKVPRNGYTVTWMRGQASPEVWRVTFEHSPDGVIWTSLGNGTRITGGWQLTGLSLPFNQNHYVRARGYAMGGIWNGSNSLFESVRMFHIDTRIIDLVTKYYNDILDRAPEPGGAEAWTAEIERIMSLGIHINEGFIAVGKSFFNSAEYLLMNKTNAAYVTDLYETFLQRPPVQAEIDYWVGYLTQGMSRNIALYYFVYSAEFKLYMEGIFGVSAVRPENNLVNDFYRGILNRLPDTAGFNAWIGLMRTAQCTGAQQVRDLSHQIALGFIQSAEYVLRARTNSQYVEDLYDAILRRGALPPEVSAWEALLNAGATRVQVLQGFTDSPEFQIRVTEVIDAGCF